MFGFKSRKQKQVEKLKEEIFRCLEKNGSEETFENLEKLSKLFEELSLKLEKRNNKP